jgi:hypothetical protein
MKIIFLNDKNMFEFHDPIADIVEVNDNIGVLNLKNLETHQPGAGRMGGSWQKIMEDGEIEFKLISSGKKSDFEESDYDIEYKLISGNY